MSEETALTIREETRPSLLSGSPRERVAQATEIAQALAPVIEKQHLFVQIQNKRHVLYEGWTTLGALVGVFPITAWSRPTADGWEARVEARTLSGAIVGAAESECSRSESRWVKADAYAIRSMAQTRAGSKALRMPLGFIMQLGGFDATPAEEMEGIVHSATKPQKPPTSRATAKVAADNDKPNWDAFWAGQDRADLHRWFQVENHPGEMGKYAQTLTAERKCSLAEAVRWMTEDYREHRREVKAREDPRGDPRQVTLEDLKE